MKLIKLTQGKFAQVDDDDFEYLNQYNWYVLKNKQTYYAYTTSSVSMHRMILELKDHDIKGDHIDRNGLNNQRHNLRVATNSQNTSNRKRRNQKGSTYKGVWKVMRSGNEYWLARCDKEGKRHYKYCKTEIQAALAYNEMAIKYHGEFAYLNLIKMNNQEDLKDYQEAKKKVEDGDFSFEAMANMVKAHNIVLEYMPSDTTKILPKKKEGEEIS